MVSNELQLNLESLQTELVHYKKEPFKCLYEYIWNSFDAGATEIKINFKLPLSGIGDIDLINIEDNGFGWDFKTEKNTLTFLSSTKNNEKNKNKTLPRGKYGRGRYVFIWIAEQLEILSLGQKLILQHNTAVKPVSDNSAPRKGTIVSIIKPKRHFSGIFFNEKKLIKEMLLEFCWFLKENPTFSISINNTKINFEENIKEENLLTKNDFDQNIKKHLSDNFKIEIILWKEKPTEWSNFYFINEDNKKEIFFKSTGMNKKSDDFWHSVYVISNLFKSDDLDEDIENQLNLGDKEQKVVKKQILEKIKQKLVEIRKPYLVKQSNMLISNFKEENIIPDLKYFGIYDEKSYEELLKTAYIIAPSLFVGKDKKEQKFMCATFAGFVSLQDSNLVKIILEQLQTLTESEKKDLLDILQRTTLSNIIKTIKEIDHRLEVIDKLKVLISEHEKETLEVRHIQTILNENFWIFGEQFRLFSTTEGALKNVLVKYAKEILEIEDPELNTEPNGEVDLFLIKTEDYNGIQRNIIVELKRASIKLSQEKEYNQIDLYRKKILSQSLCNSENQYWEFYLIGKEYDSGIAELIDNAKQHGEKEKGLAFSINDGKVKIYVRKWSDILEVEWGTKMKYLKEKLEIKAKAANNKSSDNIVSDLISKK